MIYLVFGLSVLLGYSLFENYKNYLSKKYQETQSEVLSEKNKDLRTAIENLEKQILFYRAKNNVIPLNKNKNRKDK